MFKQSKLKFKQDNLQLYLKLQVEIGKSEGRAVCSLSVHCHRIQNHDGAIHRQVTEQVTFLKLSYLWAEM